MRLICGVWHFDGRPASAPTLDAMAREMIAPGLTPQIRTWRDGPLGLGVVDFSQRAGPDTSIPRTDDGRVLAADIRLDDARTLGATLNRSSCGDDDSAAGRVDALGRRRPSASPRRFRVRGMESHHADAVVRPRRARYPAARLSPSTRQTLRVRFPAARDPRRRSD